MKKLLTSCHILVLPVLLGAWAGAHAQSLGTPSASAWIGRPLEMTVPARFASADTRDECVHAVVSFGDTRLPPHRVRATVVGSDPTQKRIRIETDTLIDEPIVTVSVRAGCRGAITRSYTLLPELASDQVVASLAAQRPWALPPAPPLSPAMAAVAAAAPASPLRLVATPATAPADAAPRTAPAPRTRAARAASTAPVATGPARPRLRLEPIDLEGSTLLRTSARLAEPAGDAARRATAALLWQAINADPQDVLRTTVLLRNVERELAQLRQSDGQTRAEIAALRQRLDAAQPWHESTATLQALAMFLLASVVAAGLLWARTRRGEDGRWHAQAPILSVEPALQARAASEAAPPPQADGAAPQPASEPAPEPLQVQPSPRVPAAAADLPMPATDTPGLRVETLAALVEQVEFLSSLGLSADAADLLKCYLQDSRSPAPLAFFELMRLCEQAQDAETAASVRRRYAQFFGVEAPRLAEVTAPVPLESLAALSKPIVVAWNTPRVAQVIEETLFGMPAAGSLTLQAGRDLLCLHGLARELAGDQVSAPEQDEVHALAPWAHAEDGSAARPATPAADVDDGSVLGVDIDLGRPPPERDLAPLVAEMHAAAREAQERAASQRRREEEEERFSAVMAYERMPIARR